MTKYSLDTYDQEFSEMEAEKEQKNIDFETNQKISINQAIMGRLVTLDEEKTSKIWSLNKGCSFSGRMCENVLWNDNSNGLVFKDHNDNFYLG